MRGVLPLSLGERTMARRGARGERNMREAMASINGEHPL